MNRVEEGDILVASVFVKDPGLALAPKMCPDQSQTFKEVNNSQAVTVEETKNDPFFFSRDDPLPGVPRNVCSVSRKYSKN